MYYIIKYNNEADEERECRINAVSELWARLQFEEYFEDCEIISLEPDKATVYTNQGDIL